jgi:hypothetical protein
VKSWVLSIVTFLSGFCTDGEDFCRLGIRLGLTQIVEGGGIQYLESAVRCVRNIVGGMSGQNLRTLEDALPVRELGSLAGSYFEDILLIFVKLCGIREDVPESFAGEWAWY